jgi:hypothetical protein
MSASRSDLEQLRRDVEALQLDILALFVLIRVKASDDRPHPHAIKDQASNVARRAPGIDEDALFNRALGFCDRLWKT